MSEVICLASQDSKWWCGCFYLSTTHPLVIYNLDSPTILSSLVCSLFRALKFRKNIGQSVRGSISPQVPGHFITSFLYLASSLGFLLALDMKKLMVMLSSQVSVMDWAGGGGHKGDTTTSWRSPDSEHQQRSPPLYIDKIIWVVK